MDEVHQVLTFLMPAFRPIIIPEFAKKEGGGTLALAKMAVTANYYEGNMQLTFKGRGNPGRIAKFIVALGQELSPNRNMWSADGFELAVSYYLGEAGSTERPIDRPVFKTAMVMMRHCLKLFQLCQIPDAKVPVPRIVWDLVYGHSASDGRAVPLGKKLMQQTSSELARERRMHN
jgi:hypothetical protein